MTAADWNRLRPLLSELLQLPEEEHAVFLAQNCGDDLELASELRRLYSEEQDDVGFLRSPFDGAGRDGRALCAGDRIGPYRLVSELGQGGMGVVWLAERDDGFLKRVALKIIKRGMDTEQVVRRFLRERQLLADLEHPGIVRLLDGGASEDGRPYLALEVVKGLPIDEHCKGKRLPLSERLRIFLQVCEAVSVAHEFGIVHRDLKPSNILVTESGQPKVLDFGIAKVLSEEGSELSLLTRTGERMLTPRYAAPEQVRGEECSPATDVYSLGVLLYELLCDHPPYSIDTASLREIEAAVCEQLPRRPSRSAHGTTRRHLAGDLDVITLRSLAKEPQRRYRDASGLARDVRRHLAHQPIHARPDSAVYRVGKYVRRNRLLVGSALAIALALTIGLAASLVQYGRSERRREEAEWSSYLSSIRRAEVQIALQSDSAVEWEKHRPEFYGWERQHMQARADLSTRIVCDLDVSSELDIDPSGQILATRQGGDILLIDVASGEVTKRLPTGDPVADLDFSPDGLLIASAHRGFVRIYDLHSCTRIAEWPTPGTVKQVRFHPDGRRVAASHANEAVTLHSLDHPSSVRELIVVKGIVRDLEFSPSGSRLAVAAVGDVVVIGVDDPELNANLMVSERERSVRVVAFSTTGRYLAGASMDGTLRVWEASSGLPIAPPRHFGGMINALAFLPDRDVLVTGTDTLRLWDLESGRENYLPGAGSTIREIAPHPEKALLYTTRKTGRVQEWDTRIEQVPRHHLGNGRCGALSVHPDGHSYSVVLANGSRLARVELQTGDVLAECPAIGKVLDLAYAPDASSLIAVRDLGLDVLDSETLETLEMVPIEQARCLAFSPGGRRLIVGTGSGKLVMVDPSSWTIRETLATPFEQVRELAFNPGGDLLAVSGEGEPGVFLLHVSDGDWSSLEGGPISMVSSLAWSPDGRLIAAGSDGGLRVWSARSLSVVYERALRRAKVAFPADSERLITCNFRSIHVLDTRRWDQVLQLSENQLSLSDMTLAPDGRTLLTSDWAGDVLVWNAAPMQNPK